MSETEYVQFAKGDRVTGAYCGEPLTGTIVDIVYPTTNPNLRLVEVKPDDIGAISQAMGWVRMRDTVICQVGPNGVEPTLHRPDRLARAS